MFLGFQNTQLLLYMHHDSTFIAPELCFYENRTNFLVMSVPLNYEWLVYNYLTSCYNILRALLQHIFNVVAIVKPVHHVNMYGFQICCHIDNTAGSSKLVKTISGFNDYNTWVMQLEYVGCSLQKCNFYIQVCSEKLPCLLVVKVSYAPAMYDNIHTTGLFMHISTSYYN